MTEHPDDLMRVPGGANRLRRHLDGLAGVLIRPARDSQHAEKGEAMKRVMVPQNLLVWAVVDTETGEVTDLWASDIHDNYWDDQYVHNGTLYYLSDWEDEDVSDPVESGLARKAWEQIQEATWPKLRIEDSAR